MARPAAAHQTPPATANAGRRSDGAHAAGLALDQAQARLAPVECAQAGAGVGQTDALAVAGGEADAIVLDGDIQRLAERGPR